MCTETGIKNVYQGVQGACPRRAVTHAGGTAERSERRAVGMGLKLVLIMSCHFGTCRPPLACLLRTFCNDLIHDN